ncbi:Ig-like domain repeat protein [Paenibacillus rigui]|uniref:Ig-like domain-containing protein n=1 Tax=Paenibacillus rigui TaxID=554312 RepID=A0A229UM96_9BACL|nr:Ig-like domain repeat protein [Paenibacillus rigui]OXM84503.1 hypothetical protein CF651_20330 [Paenibacillus rigui]
MKSWVRKCLSMTLTVSMLAASMSWTEGNAQAAAGEFLDIYANGTKIVNYSDMSTWTTSYDNLDAANAFIWFLREQNNDIPGVDIVEGDDPIGYDDRGPKTSNGSQFKGTIQVAQIPELKRLAESGQAKLLLKVGDLYESDDDWASIELTTSASGHRWKPEDDSDDVDSGWLSFAPNDIITIETHYPGSAAVTGLRLYFADIELPVVTDYTFTSDGTERDNTQLNQKELFLKKNQSLHLRYNFNEAVKASAPAALNSLSSHDLFTNPAGTGLPAAGQRQGLKLDLTTDQAKDYTTALPYTYTAADFHQTGNLPIANGGELETSQLNDESLNNKMLAAEFHDAAGNPLQLTGFNKSASSSSGYLQNKTVNPFDYGTDKGYRVIVDAVPPKYTPNANGIQPDIVTGSTLNKGDVIDFKVQLSEDAIVKEGWQPGGLYLLFNNGMKAYYVDGQNSSLWTFRAKVTNSDSNVSLLKAIALTHDMKPDQTDKGVIQDYAGNLLLDSANTSKSDNPDPSQAVANTKIDWAKLSIDNEKPKFSYIYEQGGATAATYGRTGKITMDANDPAIMTPELDPDEPGAVRPSRGIYRPLNMTGETPSGSPGVGLVYYYWSQSEGDPLADKAQDQFAAVKRYSLTGLQPSEGLYPGELAQVGLMVANNKTNLLLPPAEAFKPENSGIWYLHSWTADMTWDTARELMQYEKMKTYKNQNPTQYNTWKNEFLASHPGGSNTDAETYADSKALEAVGKYSDLTIWTPEDYKHDDSNWVYDVAKIKLDNQPPELSAHISKGNNTSEVIARIDAEDAHSGIDPAKLQYQWVKAGDAEQEIGWKQVPESKAVTTLNEVFDDGEYELHVRASDFAGNSTAVTMEEHAVVNSTVTIPTAFTPEPSEKYVQSHDIIFSIQNLNAAAVSYAYSSSAALPSDDKYAQAGSLDPSVTAAVYASVTHSVYGDTVTSSVYRNSYLIPKQLNLNGKQYVHVRVKEDGTNRNYYYYMPYLFDNTPPAAGFSTKEVGYPKPSHTVEVTANDLYNQDGMVIKYQWLRAGDLPPVEVSLKWLPIPDEGKVSIDNSTLAPGQVEDYILYVYALDGAGNGTIAHTGLFRVSREDHAPIEVLQSDLIYLDGDQVDGYQAVVKLELKNKTMAGYELSVSTDDGLTWQAWRPYSNFVKFNVPSGRADQLKLKVKFRSASGVVGDAVSIDSRGYVPSDEPLYGLVAYSTMRPAAGPFAIEVKVPAGVKVVPAEMNPMQPVRTKGNTFEVNQNGLYTFNLSDTLDPSRKEQLLFSVNNIDNTPPVGAIEQKITGPTTANVMVKLSTSEDVRITNNEGRNTYIFTENGSFTFEFEDEAGNKGTATATVTNIDREQPQATVVKSYAYGEQGAKRLKTIQDADGHVLLAEGVTLQIEKPNAGGKDFKVIRGSQLLTLFQDGKAEFTIADLLGNTTVLEETVNGIVSSLPEPDNIVYTFVDEQGNPLPDDQVAVIGGKRYAKGKMKVTLHGKVAAPNQVFRGTVPVLLENGQYSNKISDAAGSYSYDMAFGTNGEMRVALTDLLGHVNKLAIRVDGLDNTAPTIALNRTMVAIEQNKANFNPLTDLGGYTVSDNVSDAAHLKVTVEGVDISRIGKQTATYTVTDEVGNQTAVKQEVVVLPNAGLLITGNGQVLSSALGESVLFDTNRISFKVTGYDEMKVDGQSLSNELGRFDILYHSGLYREGQMKYIAKQITMEQLLNNQYEAVFPETGWYTIIVRTQEREREFASFFIGKLSK